MTIMYVGSAREKTRFKVGDHVRVAPHYWRIIRNGENGEEIDTTSHAKEVSGIVVYVHNGMGNNGKLEYVVKLLEDAGCGWYKGDSYRARSYLLAPDMGG